MLKIFAFIGINTLLDRYINRIKRIKMRLFFGLSLQRPALRFR